MPEQTWSGPQPCWRTRAGDVYESQEKAFQHDAHDELARRACELWAIASQSGSPRDAVLRYLLLHASDLRLLLGMATGQAEPRRTVIDVSGRDELDEIRAMALQAMETLEIERTGRENETTISLVRVALDLFSKRLEEADRCATRFEEGFKGAFKKLTEACEQRDAAEKRARAHFESLQAMRKLVQKALEAAGGPSTGGDH